MSNGFKETEIGRIPNEWDVKVLGSSGIARISSGGTPDRTRLDYYQGTIPWVKSGELNDSTILDTEEHISEVALNDSSAKLFPINTVLVAMYGATVGRTAILKRECATNQAVCAIQAIDMLTPAYLRQHLAFIRPFLLNQRYGGAQPNISQTIIKNLKIPLPPLPEQKKIAAVLSKLQKAIEIQDNILGSLRDLKKSMMHRLFSYGLKSEKRKKTEIGLIPEGQSPSGELCNHDGIGTPLLNGPTEFGRQQPTPVQYTSAVTKLALKGDILFCVRGNTVGRLNIADQDYCIGRGLAAIRGNSVESDTNYVFYLCQQYKDLLYSHSVAGGSTFPNISKADLQNFLMPFPPLDEQTAIAHILQTIDRKIEIHEGKKSGYQDLFKTMLNNLMTGTIRVNELDIDTAEVEAA